MITVHHLHKQFAGITAVSDLSFEAADGRITGLLGANGAGKSTTMRMICGVLKPQRGSVWIDGSSSNPQPRVGALLDHMGLYPRLTARENLMYFGELRGLPPARLRERVEELLGTLGLEPIADRRAAGFSQGQRMKTALGRALIHSPGNLLLDEPTNGLDVHTVRSLRDVLKKMRDAGTCVLLSSHVLQEVCALCDRVVIVSKGSVVAQGSPDELCLQSASASLEDAFVKLTHAEENGKC